MVCIYALKRRTLYLILFFAVTTLACGLINPPKAPTIPTPPPTIPTIFDPISSEVRINPESASIPLKDPALVNMINEVSEQDLVAYVNTLAGFGTRHTLSETQLGDYGIGAARTFLFNEFSNISDGRMIVRYQDFNLQYGGVTTQQRNVVAILPGTGPDPEMILMVGHYDSRSIDPADGLSLAPGANDNASGVAAMLEVARIMSARQWNRTVAFVAFAAEEQGTHGSNRYVTEAWLEGESFAAVINNDIIGGRPGIPQSIRVFAPADDLSNARQLARYMAYVGGLYMPAFPINIQFSSDREGRYSDHIEFLNVQVPAVRLTESIEDSEHQHNSSDFPNLLDYNYLRQATQLNLAVLASMAGAPPPPPPPQVARMADPGGFILTWTPDNGVAGYAISFRPLGQDQYPPLRIVSREDAGNIALTDFDPFTTYAVSMAAIDVSGRMGMFSQEIIIQP